MSQPPEGPEYYAPPPQAPVPIPPPPSISDAAAQYGKALNGQAQVGASPYAYAPPARSGGPQGLAIASLVLGIIALVTGWIPVWGILLGVIAVILGGVALAKKQSKGMAISGIVTGVVGALISVGVLIVVIMGANWFSDPDNWSSDWPADYDDYYSDGTTLGPESVDGSLAIAEQAFGQSTSDDTMWWYVVILDNPNDEPFPYADVTVEALDANGTVLDSSWTYLTLAPGETAFVGTFWDLDGASVASIAVVGPPADAVGGSVPQGTLEVSGLSVTSTEWGTDINGTVTSTFDESVYGGIVAIIARDASGAIIGGTNGYVGELEPGASATFSAYLYDSLPEGTEYEAFATAY